MSTSSEYANFIIGQLALLEDIFLRKMMGEYLIYYRGKIFGGIYDDRFLVKITESSKRLMPEAVEEIPYHGAKPMLLVDGVDHKEFLRQLVLAMYEELPMPTKKTKKKTKAGV